MIPSAHRRRDEGQVNRTLSARDGKFPGANSLALYTAKKQPKLTKFYNIGPDYEYGRTMWSLFQAKTKELNPKAQFIGEQWPKLATPDYTSYINAILQAKPDAVFCSLWGGDLVAFFKQAKPYGLFDKMKWVIATGADVSLARAMGKEMPTGITPTRYSSTADQQEEPGFGRRTGEDPSIERRAAQGEDGVYSWPRRSKAESRTREVIAALEGLTIDAPRGEATLGGGTTTVRRLHGRGDRLGQELPDRDRHEYRDFPRGQGDLLPGRVEEGAGVEQVASARPG